MGNKRVSIFWFFDVHEILFSVAFILCKIKQSIAAVQRLTAYLFPFLLFPFIEYKNCNVNKRIGKERRKNWVYQSRHQHQNEIYVIKS